MKLSTILATAFLSFGTLLSASPTSDAHSLSIRELSGESSADLNYNALEKRKGGGGGKGGGGKGGGSTSGGKGGSGGRPIGSYSFSPHSNAGGRTRDGSGIPPSYPGGRYAGGATVPYTSGLKSPSRGISPYAFPLIGFGIFPGIWLYGSLYAYPYYYPYYWNHNGRNSTANITCLCQRYSVCGCDPNDNSTFIQDVVGNGTDHPVNSTVSRFVTWPNGTSMAYLNGTLPNGTTASGGTDPSNADEIGAAIRLMAGYTGYWIMIVTVAALVLL